MPFAIVNILSDSPADMPGTIARPGHTCCTVLRSGSKTSAMGGGGGAEALCGAVSVTVPVSLLYCTLKSLSANTPDQFLPHLFLQMPREDAAVHVGLGLRRQGVRCVPGRHHGRHAGGSEARVHEWIHNPRATPNAPFHVTAIALPASTSEALVQSNESIAADQESDCGKKSAEHRAHRSG